MSVGASTVSLTGGAGCFESPQLASATTLSATALSGFHHIELDPGPLQTLGQRGAHRLRRGDLASGLRQLVLRQAQSRLREHPRCPPLARVAAAALTDDPLAAALTVEVDAEPRLRPLLLI